MNDHRITGMAAVHNPLVPTDQWRYMGGQAQQLRGVQTPRHWHDHYGSPPESPKRCTEMGAAMCFAFWERGRPAYFLWHAPRVFVGLLS